MTIPTDEDFAEQAYAAGRADLAAELYRRAAIAKPSEHGDALHAAALSLMQQGHWAEAEPKLLAALRAEPSRADRHDHLGVIHANLGRVPEAEVGFRMAVRLDPQHRPALRNLIQACFDLKKFDKAVAIIVAGRERFPLDSELGLQLAVAHSEAKRYAEAEAVLLALPADVKQTAHYWNRLGVVRGMAGRAEDAVACFLKQIESEPDAAAGWANIAAAYGKANRWEEAVAAGREATRLDPKAAGGWANLGNALRDLGRLAEAEIALREAIELDPKAPESPGNLALTLAMNGRGRDALPWYDEAIRRKPDSAETRFNRAVCLLALGDYEAGWREYEWRWGTEQMRTQKQARSLPMPQWRGENLAGKTLLIHAEQGHGDTIQFLKLAAPLARSGAKIVAVVSTALAALAKTVPGIDSVVVHGQSAPKYDFHSPLLSLPLLMSLRVETIPTGAPYITAPADRIEHWRQRLAGIEGRKIGIAWQGNPNHIGDRWRSVRLDRFAEIARMAGVTLIAVQKGFGRDQLDSWTGPPILDLGAELADDFADTAGLLKSLDTVITVDSALAHLAGALAVPVSILLPSNADWRWLQDRTDSPWYPSAVLHRQARFGDWDSAFHSLARELSGS